MKKRDLVIKFLSNQCTAEEAEEAMQFITENPGILEELSPASEWDTDQTAIIPQETAEDIWRHVAAATRKGKITAMWKPLAVAAAVITLIIGAFIFMPPVPKQQAIVAVDQPVSAPAFDTVINESNGVRQLLLADGSRIKLYARSSVIYSTPFTAKRDIFLTGKAVFHVAKDPRSPFVVHSGAITTTALGTVFLVNAGEAATGINVQLYEGKVVVRSVDAQLSIGDTYLLPGEQCNVDLALAKVEVSRIQELASNKNNRGLMAKPVKENEAGQLALDFEKVPLETTFKRLQRIFGKEIVFNGNNKAQDLFTGHFDQSDSLSQILQIIAGMNGLQVQQEGNTFRLSPKAATTNATSPQISGGPRDVAAPEIIPVPAVIPPAAVDSSRDIILPDANTMRIVDLPTGKDYRKVPLSMVFDQIAKTNNVTIKYQQEQIQKLYFTGTIPNDNSSIDMLPVICRMNGLKLIKRKGGEYTVKLAKQ
ncbi:FecR family protein [Longitalea luteola]|uniref:FecR family protein n=1 Tax=Longitalea luteola TaxID=2812563 RepID=UPI001A972E77|nr:FecR family protein [Longitalea luteola]